MTHWKKLTNPNYLGVYALDDGKDMILTIAYVRQETVVGSDGKKEELPVCHFSESVKPMILNTTNMKCIEKLYKTPFIENWMGKKIQIGSERVMSFGTLTDGIRVRNVIPDTAEITCSDCGGVVRATGDMSAESVAAFTTKKFGCILCATCAKKKAKEAVSSAKAPNQ